MRELKKITSSLIYCTTKNELRQYSRALLSHRSGYDSARALHHQCSHLKNKKEKINVRKELVGVLKLNNGINNKRINNRRLRIKSRSVCDTMRHYAKYSRTLSRRSLNISSAGEESSGRAQVQEKSWGFDSLRLRSFVCVVESLG
jgi:hypothetical protein